MKTIPLFPLLFFTVSSLGAASLVQPEDQPATARVYCPESVVLASDASGTVSFTIRSIGHDWTGGRVSVKAEPKGIVDLAADAQSWRPPKAWETLDYSIVLRPVKIGECAVRITLEDGGGVAINRDFRVVVAKPTPPPFSITDSTPILWYDFDGSLAGSDWVASEPLDAAPSVLEIPIPGEKAKRPFAAYGVSGSLILRLGAEFKSPDRLYLVCAGTGDLTASVVFQSNGAVPCQIFFHPPAEGIPFSLPLFNMSQGGAALESIRVSGAGKIAFAAVGVRDRGGIGGRAVLFGQGLRRPVDGPPGIVSMTLGKPLEIRLANGDDSGLAVSMIPAETGEFGMDSATVESRRATASGNGKALIGTQSIKYPGIYDLEAVSPALAATVKYKVVVVGASPDAPPLDTASTIYSKDASKTGGRGGGASIVSPGKTLEPSPSSIQKPSPRMLAVSRTTLHPFVKVDSTSQSVQFRIPDGVRLRSVSVPAGKSLANAYPPFQSEDGGLYMEGKRVLSPRWVVLDLVDSDGVASPILLIPASPLSDFAAISSGVRFAFQSGMSNSILLAPLPDAMEPPDVENEMNDIGVSELGLPLSPQLTAFCEWAAASALGLPWSAKAEVQTESDGGIAVRILFGQAGAPEPNSAPLPPFLAGFLQPGRNDFQNAAVFRKIPLVMAKDAFGFALQVQAAGMSPTPAPRVAKADIAAASASAPALPTWMRPWTPGLAPFPLAATLSMEFKESAFTVAESIFQTWMQDALTGQKRVFGLSNGMLAWNGPGGASRIGSLMASLRTASDILAYVDASKDWDFPTARRKRLLDASADLAASQIQWDGIPPGLAKSDVPSALAGIHALATLSVKSWNSAGMASALHFEALIRIAAGTKPSISAIQPSALASPTSPGEVRRSSTRELSVSPWPICVAISSTKEGAAVSLQILGKSILTMTPENGSAGLSVRREADWTTETHYFELAGAAE